MIIGCFSLITMYSCNNEAKEASKESAKELTTVELLKVYKAQLDSVKQGEYPFEYDSVLMSKIITDMQLLGYTADDMYIDCSTEKDIATISNNFLQDMLYMQADASTDSLLKSYCTQMDNSKISTKYRAVFYYLTMAQIGMGDSYKEKRFILSDSFSMQNYNKIPRNGSGTDINVTGCLQGLEIKAEGKLLVEGKPPMGYEIHYKSTADAEPIVIAKGLAFNPDGSFIFKGKLPEGANQNLSETGGDILIVFTNGSTSVYSGNCDGK